MYHFFAIILVLLGLPAVFYVPFLIRRPRVRQVLDRFLSRFRRAPNKVAFYPLEFHDEEAPCADKTRRKCLVQGAVLCIAVVTALLFVTFPGEASKMYATVRDALLGGLILGGIVLLGHRRVREAQVTQRCSRLLDGMGLSGMWLTDTTEGQPFSFSRVLIDEISQHRTLDAMGCSGLTFLRALSHPHYDAFKAPHPALQNAKIRLLLVPPRSRKIDPERRRCSCAESALARLERRPEQHWRDLHHALEIRNHWVAHYGIDLDVRFLEDRPSFQALFAGPHAWFRPWASSGNSWFEVLNRGRHDQLYGIVRDMFASTWGNASAELCVSLAAGPTGSTILRKGVIVDATEDASQQEGNPAIVSG